MAKSKLKDMSKYRIQLLSKGVRELLKSPEIRSDVYQVASKVKNNAGTGYEIGQYTAKTRNVMTVYAADDNAKRDNLKNNTLLKALN